MQATLAMAPHPEISSCRVQHDLVWHASLALSPDEWH